MNLAVNQAVVNLLARYNPLDRLLEEGADALERMVREEYLPVVDVENMDPDSLSANESAMLEEDTLVGAASTWKRMSQEKRRIVLMVVHKMEGDAKDLRDILDDMLPISRPRTQFELPGPTT